MGPDQFEAVSNVLQEISTNKKTARPHPESHQIKGRFTILQLAAKRRLENT